MWDAICNINIQALVINKKLVPVHISFPSHYQQILLTLEYEKEGYKF